MKVLVTGATGLVGRGIMRKLIDIGASVVTLGMEPTGNDTFIYANLKDIGRGLKTCPMDIDAIVHCGAVVNDSLDLDEYRLTNIDATHILTKWADDNGINAFIFLSSMSMLHRPIDHKITEDHPICPLTPYAMSKRWGELCVSSLTKKHFIFRLSSPIPDTIHELHDTVIRKWIVSAKRHEPLTIRGSGRRTQDFVYNGDIGKAVHLALSNKDAPSGIYNIASGTTISMNMLSSIIAKKYNVETRHVPADSNEEDRWNISIANAREHLGYIPSYTAVENIERILANDTGSIK